jgi:hypothetical protein
MTASYLANQSKPFADIQRQQHDFKKEVVRERLIEIDKKALPN